MPSRLSIIPAEALADARLSDGDIRVLAALGTFTDRGGKCWPSCESVAEVAGCAIRSVRRSVTHLAKCGYVVREARYGRSNVYVVKLDTPDCTVPPPRTVESSPPDRAVPHNVVLNVPKNVVGVPEIVLVAASGYLTDPKTREARVGCLRSLLQGMTGKPYPPEVVVRGLEDMRVAGVDFRPVVVRTWCDRAAKELQGEAGRRAAQGDSSVLGQPDANQGHWSEDELT